MTKCQVLASDVENSVYHISYVFTYTFQVNVIKLTKVTSSRKMISKMNLQSSNAAFIKDDDV